MTHEELLAKINKDIVPGNYHIEAYLALRAIVELHKSIIDGMCGKCLGSLNGWAAYPCETIQAIEKELA